MDVWTQCKGSHYIRPLAVEAWRVVEAQHISATRKLVDSAEEQAILEDLIEQSKPLYATSRDFLNLHYLLATPFRYPPLQYGSRFGTPAEPSLWYGSQSLIAALAEVAYYRFIFLSASHSDFGLVETWHSAFVAKIKTPRGIDLSLPPFIDYKHYISSPTHYHVSQALGTAMRTAQVEAFCYNSARAPEHGINIALFTPKAFAAKNPKEGSFQTWRCLTTATTVEFVCSSLLKPEAIIFPIAEFLVENRLPLPFSLPPQSAASVPS